MVNDAEDHEAEDKARKEAIEARNQLDSLIYNTQKLIDANRDKIPEAERVAVEEAMKSGKEVLEKNKATSTPRPSSRRPSRRVQKASHKMAEAMYRKAGPPSGGGGGTGPGVEDVGGDGNGDGERPPAPARAARAASATRA